MALKTMVLVLRKIELCIVPWETASCSELKQLGCLVLLLRYHDLLLLSQVRGVVFPPLQNGDDAVLRRSSSLISLEALRGDPSGIF